MTQTSAVVIEQREKTGQRHGVTVALTIAGKYGTIIGLVAMIVILSIAAPDTFFSTSNFINVLTQNSLIAIVACGMTLPLVVGEFDLSLGYQASFASVLTVGLMTNQGWSMPVSIVVGLATGLAAGRQCAHSDIGYWNGNRGSQLRLHQRYAHHSCGSRGIS
jgi:ribose transport system permease protein